MVVEDSVPQLPPGGAGTADSLLYFSIQVTPLVGEVIDNVEGSFGESRRECEGSVREV